MQLSIPGSMACILKRRFAFLASDLGTVNPIYTNMYTNAMYTNNNFILLKHNSDDIIFAEEACYGD